MLGLHFLSVIHKNFRLMADGEYRNACIYFNDEKIWSKWTLLFHKFDLYWFCNSSTSKKNLNIGANSLNKSILSFVTMFRKFHYSYTWCSVAHCLFAHIHFYYGKLNVVCSRWLLNVVEVSTPITYIRHSRHHLVAVIICICVLHLV